MSAITKSPDTTGEAAKLPRETSTSRHKARQANRAEDAGYASCEEYSEAMEPQWDTRRVESRKMSQEDWDEAVRSGRDPERQNREHRGRAREEEEKQSTPWYLTEKCSCNGRPNRTQTYLLDANKGAEHLTPDFCEGNLQSPEGSMNGVSDLFREQIRPRLEDMVIDERKPSNRYTEANLRQMWSEDSEDEQHELLLPNWADRDPIMQHLIAERTLRQSEAQKEPSLSGYLEISSDPIDDGGRVDSLRRRVGRFETKQNIGKRSTKEREENDDMNDSDNNTRRVRVRRDETQQKTYHNTSFIRYSNDASAAYLPRTPSRSRASSQRFHGSSKAETAMSWKRLSRSPFPGSRPAATVNPLNRLRDTLAAEGMDEEARTPFPFAETAAQVFDMEDSSPERFADISPSPLSDHGRLKRTHDNLMAEGDRYEERTPKRLRGTAAQTESPQRHFQNDSRPTVHRAGPREYSGSRIISRGPKSIDTRAGGVRSRSPFPERLQHTAHQDSPTYQVSLNTKVPDPARDVVESVPEGVEAQISSLGAGNSRAQALLQRLRAIRRGEAQGFPIQQEPQNHGRNVPGGGSLKRDRESPLEEEEHDPAGAFASPSKRLRRTKYPHGTPIDATTEAAAATGVTTTQEPDFEANAADGAAVLAADRVAADLTAAVDAGTVLGPSIQNTNRCRGAQKGRVEKNPPAGIQKQSREGGPSKTKTRAKTKAATVTSSWLKTLLANPRQTRSQNRKVFVELDAQS
ncbi:MAG: hypothetical protein Q9192_005787 [Flavoplaca navasiana]